MAILKVTHNRDDYEGKEDLEIILGDIRLRFYDGEPEDNTLARNFSGCKQILGLVQYAHELGIKVIHLVIESSYQEI